MITIHGLPPSTNYQELKGMIRDVSKLREFILDELLPDDDGTKKVRVGVTDVFEGNHLIDCLNGFRMGGNLLRAEPFRRTPRNKLQKIINLWVSSNCPSNNRPGPSGDFGSQMGLGNNIPPWGDNSLGCPNPNQGRGMQMLRHNFSHLYQREESQPFQQGPSRRYQQVSDEGYRHGRNEYEPEPCPGYQQQQSIGAGPSNNYNTPTQNYPGSFNTSYASYPKTRNPNNSNAPKPKGPGPNNTKNPYKWQRLDNPNNSNAAQPKGSDLNNPRNPNAPKPRGPTPNNPNDPKPKGPGSVVVNNPNAPNPKGLKSNNPNDPILKDPGPFVVNNPNAPEPKGPNPNAQKLKGPGPFVGNNSNAPELKSPISCGPNNPNGRKPNEPRRHYPNDPDPTKPTRRERRAMTKLRKQLHEERTKREGYVPRLAGKGGLGTFGMPCRTIMKQIRPSICLFTRGKALTPERRKLMVVIKADVKRILTKLVEGKGYLKAEQVVDLYREHYPKETDEEYVLRMQNGIRDGTVISDEQMRQWKGQETRRSAVGEGLTPAVSFDAAGAPEVSDDDWDECSGDSGDEGENWQIEQT